MDWVNFLAIGLIAAFFLLNVLPLVRARLVRGRSVPGLDAILNDTQRGKPRLLVYFWGPNCGMCRGMTPVIDQLAAERGDVVKINIADSMALAREFGVMATPSLAVVENGTLAQLIVGAQSEARIRKLLATT